MKNESMIDLEQRFKAIENQDNQVEHLMPMIIGTFKQALQTVLAKTNMERGPILESIISSEAEEKKAVDELQAAVVSVFTTVRDGVKNGAKVKNAAVVTDLETTLQRLEQHVTALFLQFATAHARTGDHVASYTKMRDARIDALTDLVTDLGDGEQAIVKMVTKKKDA